jgi:hypothetical protein
MTDVVERDEAILRLSAERMPDRQIAARLGVSTRTVERAKQRVITRNRVGELRELFFADLEAVLWNAWQVVHDPPPRISDTGAIVKDAGGKPVPDVTAGNHGS